jgi:F0F1-type ATP synthase assembly protein I
MEPMTNEEIVKELRERIADLEQYVLADDSDSEYFQGVQEGYSIAVGMITGEFPETTILPAH